VIIEFSASPSCQKALHSLVRTEDIRFSPNNRRLALADYGQNRIMVFEVVLDSAAGIALTDWLEVSSEALDHPHGLDFIDDHTLIVGNRSGNVVIFALPAAADGDLGRREAVPLRVLAANETSLLKSPGSVAVGPALAGVCDVLVCNNSINKITRHRLTLDGQFQVRDNEVLLHKHLNWPDGVTISGDGRWIAVTNLEAHNIFVYENTPTLHDQSIPDGILRLAYHPHGVRFTPDGRHLLVSDAGAPYVHVYHDDGQGWWGVRQPVASVRVLSDQQFQSARINELDGGPKGVDVSSDGQIMVVTSEAQPLAFFQMDAVLVRRPSRQASAQAVAAELYSLNRVRNRLEAYEASLSWKVTAPLRSGLDTVVGWWRQLKRQGLAKLRGTRAV
jgi:6-phosphogluconolactonase (cycloisomerase 2 family)